MLSKLDGGMLYRTVLDQHDHEMPLRCFGEHTNASNCPLETGGATKLKTERLHYDFVNTVSISQSRRLHDRCAIPCANHMLFEVAFESFTPEFSVQIDRSGIVTIAGNHRGSRTRSRYVRPDVTSRRVDEANVLSRGRRCDLAGARSSLAT